ncbi:MAG: transporter substrate-binding domain-containing protein [Desulfobacteraceae bacterium]|jgi:ABC-type amino acid transport substrate-binding protein
MFSNPKKLHEIGCGVICFWLLLVMPENAASQDEAAVSPKLVVGTVVAPPMAMRTAEGQWAGLGIEVWRSVAQRMGLSFEFREFSSLGLLADAIKSGDIDVIPFLPVEPRYEALMDFAQSYLKSGLAIAVPLGVGGGRWMRVAESIFSKDILQAVGLLVLMALTAGMIVWGFERRRNREMFGGGAGKGIGQGLWWSMTTMTTVGYGDKAPKTIGGRITAAVWMLSSIVFISSFTANITTSLTLGELHGKVRGFHDLFNARVGSIPESEAMVFLASRGMAAKPFETVHEGVQAVADKKIDAFVLNEVILKYHVKNEFPGRVQVIPGIFDEYFVGIGLQAGSPLRKPINKTLLELMKTEEWAKLLHRYNLRES